MIAMGSILKSTREARGLTIAQIAERTNLMASTINDLENDNFSKIIAPVYGRGYIKLYCGVLGIDPKPLVDAYMDMVNGKDEENEKAVEEEPPKRDEPTTTQPVEATLPLETAATIERPLPKPEEPDHFISRYSTPIRERPSISLGNPMIWRWAMIAAIGLLILWGIVALVGALHNATTDAAPAEIKTAEEMLPAANQPAASVPKVKVPRKPVKVDRLYLD